MIWTIVGWAALFAYVIGVVLVAHNLVQEIKAQDLPMHKGGVAAIALFWPVVLLLDLIEQRR